MTNLKYWGKFICLAIMTCLILSFAMPVYADNSQEIRLIEAQLQSLQWEYQYLNERMKNLQNEAQALRTKLIELKKPKVEKEKKE